ncbi:MAG TPA: rhomboid family intramembrane serine protease [Gammaproteobacteria bacterium]|nr:rhomboid family intramembrane serine protease [Gammaproteobacteria bacterium]
MNPMTPVVKALLIANGLVFLLELTSAEPLIAQFALWPIAPQAQALGLALPFHPWQLVTYSFLHGGLMHIGFNMYALWLFGAPMERVWGSRRFLTYYFVCVIGAGLVQLTIASIGARTGMAYPTIGASGGIFGVLLAFGLTFPNQMLVLLIPPIPIRAKYFVLLYGAIELWAGVTGTEAGVAHFAHLGGMLFGYLLIRYWREAG